MKWFFRKKKCNISFDEIVPQILFLANEIRQLRPIRAKRDNLFQECSQMPESEFAIVRPHKLAETLEKG